MGVWSLRDKVCPRIPIFASADQVPILQLGCAAILSSQGCIRGSAAPGLRTGPSRSALCHVSLALVVCGLSLGGRMPSEATWCPSGRKHYPCSPHVEPLKIVPAASMLQPETAARDTRGYCTQRLNFIPHAGADHSAAGQRWFRCAGTDPSRTAQSLTITCITEGPTAA